MSITTFHGLPRVSDSWSFVYVEAARVERHEYAIQISTEHQAFCLPVAQCLVLLLGPGSTLTHAAATILSERGCSVVWCGEAGVRFYGHATPETEGSTNLDRQVQLLTAAHLKEEVARRMYRLRFPTDDLPSNCSIAQLRGREGNHMRDIYAALAQRYQIAWTGRDTTADNGHPLQLAINVANSCLYGICHAAIVSVGMSPVLGFVHHGNQRSFVFDVADLYKADVVLPIAFAAVAESETNIAQRVRRACRDLFHSQRILERIVPDIYAVLALPTPQVRYVDSKRTLSAMRGE